MQQKRYACLLVMPRRQPQRRFGKNGRLVGGVEWCWWWRYFFWDCTWCLLFALVFYGNTVIRSFIEDWCDLGDFFPVPGSPTFATDGRSIWEDHFRPCMARRCVSSSWNSCPKPWNIVRCQSEQFEKGNWRNWDRVLWVKSWEMEGTPSRWTESCLCVVFTKKEKMFRKFSSF